MQKGDGMFKLSFSEEQSDYCTDSKRHKIITVKNQELDMTQSKLFEQMERRTRIAPVYILGRTWCSHGELL